MDANLSLSGWIADVVRERLGGARHKRKKTLLAVLGDPRSEGVEFDIPLITETPQAADLEG